MRAFAEAQDAPAWQALSFTSAERSGNRCRVSYKLDYSDPSGPYVQRGIYTLTNTTRGWRLSQRLIVRDDWKRICLGLRLRVCHVNHRQPERSAIFEVRRCHGGIWLWQTLNPATLKEWERRLEEASRPFLASPESGVLVSHGTGLFISTSEGEVDCMSRVNTDRADWVRLAAALRFSCQLAGLELQNSTLWGRLGTQRF